ncbi:MAG: hypothetical protein ACR2NY_05655 [Alphaproteobacteria bacterium]
MIKNKFDNYCYDIAKFTNGMMGLLGRALPPWRDKIKNTFNPNANRSYNMRPEDIDALQELSKRQAAKIKSLEAELKNYKNK